VQSRVKIPLTKPYTGKEEIEKIKQVLGSGHLTQGPVVKEFEEQFSKYLGVKHAVATTSCTSALLLTLIALDIKAGDEVILPDFTFPATGNVICNVGAKPILLDVDRSTYNIDVNKIEKAITKKTSAIIGVHLFGHPADMSPLIEIAEKYGLHIIEDAACSLGALYKGKQTGTFGDVGCFSFHPRKILTTGEGGMLVTNNLEIAEKATMIRDHGRRIRDGKSQFIYFGYNFRMSDILAAIGLMQLRKLSDMINRRRKLAGIYNGMLTERDIGIAPPVEASWAKHVFQSYVTYVTDNYGIRRDVCIKKLRDRFGVETQIGTYALHLQPAFKKYSRNAVSLNRSRELYERTLTLPLYHELTLEKQRYVIDALEQLHFKK